MPSTCLRLFRLREDGQQSVDVRPSRRSLSTASPLFSSDHRRNVLPMSPERVHCLRSCSSHWASVVGSGSGFSGLTVWRESAGAAKIACTCLAPLISAAPSSRWPSRRWSITGWSVGSALLRWVSPRLLGLGALRKTLQPGSRDGFWRRNPCTAAPNDSLTSGRLHLRLRHILEQANASARYIDPKFRDRWSMPDSERGVRRQRRNGDRRPGGVASVPRNPRSAMAS